MTMSASWACTCSWGARHVSWPIRPPWRKLPCTPLLVKCCPAGNALSAHCKAVPKDPSVPDQNHKEAPKTTKTMGPNKADRVPSDQVPSHLAARRNKRAVKGCLGGGGDGGADMVSEAGDGFKR